jgi:DNA repair exonuclease SbcCD nuclease subunit
MLFAHIADCHLGGWRDPVLREMNHKAFVIAMDRCINERTDFVLISGDLFNTAIPSIDSIRLAFEQLRRLKEAGIPLYFIQGSHDCSPSGRSVLDVIESAGLGTNVSRGEATEDGMLKLRPVVDPKTGVRLCGLLGKKGGLDKHYYEALERTSLETLPGPKIFLFHGSITELKPEELEEMDAFGLSLLPKGFDYYAGGHIHIIKQHSAPGHLNVVYPGPLFPNNFSELEKLGSGSFYLVRNWQTEQVRIEQNQVISILVNLDGKSAAQAEASLRDAIPSDAQGSILLLRVEGILSQGSPSDINFRDIISSIKNAAVVLKNTNGLTGKEFEEVEIGKGTLDEIEDRLAAEHAGKSGLFEAPAEIALTKELMRVLSSEKKEGEKVADFEKRIDAEASATIK